MTKRLILYTFIYVFILYSVYVFGVEYDMTHKPPRPYPRTDAAMAYVNTTWTDTVMWSDGMRLEGHYYYTDVYSGTDHIGTVYHPYRETGGHGLFDTCDPGLLQTGGQP